MHRLMRTALVVSLLSSMLSLTAASAADWPNWRGPNHDGVSSETGLQTRWEAPPPLLWQRAIGSAFSGIAVVGDRVYTCGTHAGKQTLLCLNADTGAVLWQQPIGEEYREGTGGDGPRGTPTVADGRVYVQGALGRMCCFEADTGKELWSRQFNAIPRWGYSGSVLIEGNLALATAGDADGALIALDKQTGKTVWKCGQAPVGYSTPCAFTFEGQRYVVGLLGKSVVIADVKDGREVWSAPWETSYDVNAATPIFHDGYLFISSGYDHGATVLKLARAGERLTTTPVWESRAIRAKFQSPVLHEGYLYTSDESGLKCVEFKTGEVKWQKRRMKHGTVVIADGHLFVLTEEGRLVIAPATPESFNPITDVEVLSGRCWTVPTLCRGRICARNLEQMVCLQLTR